MSSLSSGWRLSITRLDRIYQQNREHKAFSSPDHGGGHNFPESGVSVSGGGGGGGV